MRTANDATIFFRQQLHIAARQVASFLLRVHIPYYIFGKRWNGEKEEEKKNDTTQNYKY